MAPQYDEYEVRSQDREPLLILRVMLVSFFLLFCFDTPYYYSLSVELLSSLIPSLVFSPSQAKPVSGWEQSLSRSLVSREAERLDSNLM